MKKILSLVALFGFGLMFSTPELKADTLIADIDGGGSDTSGFWLGNDTNPDFVSPSNQGTEELWLEAVLGNAIDVSFLEKLDPSGVGGLTSWVSYDPEISWDYVVVKVGGPGGPAHDLDPSVSFNYYAFADDGLADDLFTLPGGFAFSNGVSHLTFFSGGSQEVPEPATMLLFGAGLIGLAGVQRKRKK